MKNTLRYGLDQLIKLQELQDEEFNKEEGTRESRKKARANKEKLKEEIKLWIDLF